MSVESGDKDVVRTSLGTRGIEFVTDALARGGQLSASLLRSVDLSSGTVFSYLKPSRVLADLDLEHQDLGSNESKQNESRTLALLTGELGSRRDHVLLLEHPLARPDDPFLAKSPIEYFALDTSVVFFVAGQSGGLPEIREALGWAGAQDMVGALVCGRPAAQWKDIGPVDLQQGVVRPLLLVVRAFDASGYVLWANADEGAYETLASAGAANGG